MTEHNGPLKLKLHDLTERRRRIVEMDAEGMVDKEIAAKLGISESAVRMHRNWIERRIGRWGKMAIVRYFYELTPRG